MTNTQPNTTHGFSTTQNVLLSEARLVASTLTDSKNILSVGCGSGLFEKILRDDFGITISDGIEPSQPMAEIARKRGLNVTISTAEEMEIPSGAYDTILFNGCPSYITDLDTILRKVYASLPEGGRVVLVDVPKESTYGLMYNLAKHSEHGTTLCLKAPTRLIPIRLNSSTWPTGVLPPKKSPSWRRMASAT